MEEIEKTEPGESEEDLPEVVPKQVKLSEPPPRVFDRLEPLEEKVIELSCIGHERSKIAKLCRLTNREVRNILRRDHVKQILDWKKQEIHIASAQTHALQRRNLLDKFYEGAGERFEPLRKKDLEGLSEDERQMKLATRAENTAFKDYMTVMTRFIKTDHDVSPGEKREEHELVRMVRERRRKRKITEKQEQAAYASAGIDEDALFNLTRLDADGNIEATPRSELAEFRAAHATREVEEETTTIETLEILRRRDHDEED